ncbi:MAG: hypothetical protein NTY37_10445 [Methanothrix sp.]|nr:hypothetical protein [Methanothrix sp.]
MKIGLTVSIFHKINPFKQAWSLRASASSRTRIRLSLQPPRASWPGRGRAAFRGAFLRSPEGGGAQGRWDSSI